MMMFADVVFLLVFKPTVVDVVSDFILIEFMAIQIVLNFIIYVRYTVLCIVKMSA